MKRRQFTLTIDVENSAFYAEGATVTDHVFDRDKDQDDTAMCVCGQWEGEHDDGYAVNIEVADILRQAARSMEDFDLLPLTLHDSNGHVVGQARWTVADLPEEEKHEDWCNGVLYAQWSGLSCNCGAKKEGY